MTLKEADQFMTDPLPNPKELVLVESQWLQDKLRQHHAMTNQLAHFTRTSKASQEEISYLKHRLMVAESTHHYTQIIDTRG